MFTGTRYTGICNGKRKAEAQGKDGDEAKSSLTALLGKMCKLLEHQRDEILSLRALVRIQVVHALHVVIFPSTVITSVSPDSSGLVTDSFFIRASFSQGLLKQKLFKGF